jgi:drug/metabolite transporter (DMT)-like permease
MNKEFPQKNIYIGIGLATLACIIWSGNFVVARGVIKQLPPVGMAFFRWATASLIMLPIAWKKFKAEKEIVLQHKQYFFWTALMGITLFNTCIYIAGHYSSAVTIALIGTTTSPVFSIILAAIFLGEKIKPLRIAGLLLCIAGIILLLSHGSWQRLLALHFSIGDGIMLLAALFFAVYNIMVRRKPAGISLSTYLFTVFTLGTILLLPWFLWESAHAPAIVWNGNLVLIILYLSAGASVISYFFWNGAIARLGAGRTALFGNLIPVFSSLEAVWFLKEEITSVHLISGLLVITGLIIANLRKSNAG